ncbi:CWF-like protein [Euroglyphus maynei]|uniref:CWF-like protein n=1 Tax=Euroglyphus maynei TaxID=6958 RepID=A0A1Y3APR9_EURMA|nr:CWF-like protein [Euroglyphus maynei]
MTVKELYLKTKNITAREEAMRFVATTSKIRSADDEYEGNVRGGKKAKLDSAGFDRIRFTTSNSNDDYKCDWCLENKVNRHLVLKFPEQSSHCYVTLTQYKPLIDNVCMIVSRNHSARCSLEADQECWTEIRQMMRKLSGFFSDYFNCTTVFMETVFVNKKRNQNLSSRHFVIECYPIKKRFETDAKIYFHKAILDCEQEWSINKKLIKLENNPITRKLPKGLAHFWVSIGPDFDGYGHVIEDEDYFDKNFGKDVITGMYDIHRSKSRNENFDDQMKRIKELKTKWNDYNG